MNIKFKSIVLMVVSFFLLAGCLDEKNQETTNKTTEQKVMVVGKDLSVADLIGLTDAQREVYFEAEEKRIREEQGYDDDVDVSAMVRGEWDDYVARNGGNVKPESPVVAKSNVKGQGITEDFDWVTVAPGEIDLAKSGWTLYTEETTGDMREVTKRYGKTYVYSGPWQGRFSNYVTDKIYHGEGAFAFSYSCGLTPKSNSITSLYIKYNDTKAKYVFEFTSDGRYIANAGHDDKKMVFIPVSDWVKVMGDENYRHGYYHWFDEGPKPTQDELSAFLTKLQPLQRVYYNTHADNHSELTVGTQLAGDGIIYSIKGEFSTHYFLPPIPGEGQYFTKNICNFN